jgi:drug/metabolite transporter (DMT)-like permease
MKPSLVLGVVAAILATVSWSLGFIVPFVIGRYSLFDFALVEFAFSGVMSLVLLARHAEAVRRLPRGDWYAAGSLGVIGYACYFLAVMGAAVFAGPVIAPAFLGLVPVVLAVTGNVRQRTVSWASLVLPLSLSAIGLLLVNVSGFLELDSLQAHPHSHAGTARSLLVGIPLALLAVACWTVFGLLNQSALARRPRMEVGVWTAMIMLGASLAMLMFVPFGLWMGLFAIPRLGLGWQAAGPLLLWGAVLAVFANVGGALAWTYASQRVPVALCAQMVALEPASATVLGLLVHRRWPSVAEALGMTLLLIGVMIAIGIFTRRAAVAAEPLAA